MWEFLGKITLLNHNNPELVNFLKSSFCKAFLSQLSLESLNNLCFLNLLNFMKSIKINDQEYLKVYFDKNSIVDCI